VKWYLHNLRIVQYCRTVRKTIALVLVLSMLASAQARAVHWYVDHASGALSGSAVIDTTRPTDNGDDLPRSDDDGSGATHSAGHCDVCGHAGMVAVADHSPPFQFFVGIYNHCLITRESRVGDPPVRRADKPPR
jgi:hypothetical protein